MFEVKIKRIEDGQVFPTVLVHDGDICSITRKDKKGVPTLDVYLRDTFIAILRTEGIKLLKKGG